MRFICCDSFQTCSFVSKRFQSRTMIYCEFKRIGQTEFAPSEIILARRAIINDYDFIQTWSLVSDCFKVGDYSLKIHKSEYHIFSVLIPKRGLSSLQTRKTCGKILSGNYCFLIHVIRVTPHNCAYLLHRVHTFTQQKCCLSNTKISYR